ncbi:MAG: class I SAM-dependent methyltransferase [Chlamydiales bacterium]|nr:class I SAM-dependent methyltransferase [Chlamydiales bacterium]
MKLSYILLSVIASTFSFQGNAAELPFSEHPYGVCATDIKLDALSRDLEIPPASPSGLVKTLNFGGGFMLIHLDPISSAFIEFAKTSSYPVLDIGAAYGVATLPALDHSTCAVIADDIGSENLLILQKQVDKKNRERLYLNQKRFPQELDFKPNSLGGVLICRVFHFLRGEEIEEGLKKIFSWLAPGGKLFIVTSTPYQGNITEFVSVYEERWADGISWPGYVENYGSNAPGLSSNLNPFLHVMDERPLRKALESAGFLVEKVEYIDRRKTIPTLCLDGREGIGIIASKPTF